MKKVLLTTTAVVFTAGFVSAGDMSMSGAIKLTYGSFGTGSLPVTTADDFTSEADLDIAATSAGGNITMTGTLELDESGEAAGPVTISTGALTLPKTKGKLLIIGGGIIGCEMATVYQALGMQVTICEMLPQIMPGADMDLVTPCQKKLEADGITIMTKTTVKKVIAQTVCTCLFGKITLAVDLRKIFCKKYGGYIL